MPISQSDVIGELVSKLNEVYQPIYGYPEHSRKASRKGDIRLLDIKNVHDALQKGLGRQVRVLDLGCAQAWVGLHLAQAGAKVVGVDMSIRNIELCRALAAENKTLEATFHHASVEAFLEKIRDDEYDLFLGLSVFHHLCAKHGKQAVREMMVGLFSRIGSGILELALASEPPAWAGSLPDDPKFFIDFLPSCTLLSFSRTHLSSISRPLYFCSSRFSFRPAEMTPLPGRA